MLEKSHITTIGKQQQTFQRMHRAFDGIIRSSMFDLCIDPNELIRRGKTERSDTAKIKQRICFFKCKTALHALKRECPLRINSYFQHS